MVDLILLLVAVWLIGKLVYAFGGLLGWIAAIPVKHAQSHNSHQQHLPAPEIAKDAVGPIKTFCRDLIAHFGFPVKRPDSRPT